MPPVSRIGDNSAGHCFPPIPLISGSGNVLTNGIPTGRVGDSYPVHCCGIPCHAPSQAAGSSTVIVNGVPVARIGDALTCGDMLAVGSGNVIAG